MTLNLPAAQVRPGDVVMRTDRQRRSGDHITRTAPVSDIGVGDGAVVTIRCGDGLLMALADTPVTVLRETA